jgi:hypothetical protein
MLNSCLLIAGSTSNSRNNEIRPFSSPIASTFSIPIAACGFRVAWSNVAGIEDHYLMVPSEFFEDATKSGHKSRAVSSRNDRKRGQNRGQSKMRLRGP